MSESTTTHARTSHPVAQAIGALIGAREGDRAVRGRTKRWIAGVSGGGLAVYIATQAWGLAEDGIRRTWAQSDRDQAALVTELRGLTASIDNLVWAIVDDRAQRDADHAAIMQKIGVVRREVKSARPPTRPHPVQHDETPPGGGG